MPRDMTPDEVRAFLSEGTRTGKLATTSADGHPHVSPVWFVLDGDDLVFTTGRDRAKGKHLRRDPRVALLVDDEQPPFAFVHVRGRATLTDEAPDLGDWTTQIAARYMGADQAEAFGQRNAVPEELLVRVTPERVIAQADVAGW
jgi:PPOX class probable F420-dependent enzyme